MEKFTFKPIEGFEIFEGVGGLTLITPKVFTDERGEFMEVYEKEAFHRAGIMDDFIQQNQSISKHNVARGLHYQKSPHAQAKLVRVTQGAITDVVVDLRKGSRSLGNSFEVQLDDVEHKMLYIPKGFAHGFIVRSNVAIVTYSVAGSYAPEHERGLQWRDKNMNYPQAETGAIIQSKKDEQWPDYSNEIEI